MMTSNNTAHKRSITHESFGTLTYQFSEKYSSYLQYHYVHGEEFTVASYDKSDSLGYAIGTAVIMPANVTLTFEMGSDLIASNDNKTVATTWKHPDFILYCDWSF